MLRKIKIEYIFGFLLVLYAFFMFYRLGTTIFNADEHFWFYRSQAFVNALQKGDWASTFQNPKPGVPVMLLSGVSLEVLLQLYESMYHFRPEFFTSDTFPLVSFATKAPLVLLNIASMVLITFLISKLFTKKIALYFFLLLAFQPYFIGISRYFHGDGTLTIFMTLSTVFLFYATIRRRLLVYIVSGLFAGLAILTKLQAIYLLPFAGLILLLELLGKQIDIKSVVKNYCAWLATTLLAFVAFFPAMWVVPIDTILRIYNEAFVITAHGKNAKVAFNPYLVSFPMIIKLPSIFLFLTGIYGYFVKRNKLILYSLLYILFYALQIQIVEQKSERYLLPLMPFLALVGAYGLDFLSTKLKTTYFYIVLATAIVFNFGWLIWNTPYYTAHAELAPWGAVYYEAARYLNNKPHATELKVIAVEKPHTFRPYFKGKTYGIEEVLPAGWSADYVIVGTAKQIPTKYSYCTLEREIPFRTKVYWRIYDCK